MKAIVGITILAIGLAACSESNEPTEETVVITELDGEKLMEQKCNACHNTQDSENMLAPPMYRVKDHYWDEDVSRSEFVKAIVDWCENPTEESSVMPGARRKFGLMPKQAFDSEEVTAIAEYLFDSDLESTGCPHEGDDDHECGDGEDCGAH